MKEKFFLGGWGCKKFNQLKGIKMYLSAFLEDITISLIVIAGSPRLAVHVRNILWLFIKLKRGQAWFVLSGLFATEFTSFCR